MLGATSNSHSISTASVEKSKTADSGIRGPLHILILDEDGDTRRLYESYFRFQGARPVVAADDAEALRLVRLQRPDVIVLDLSRPGATGGAVLQDLKADALTRGIPVLVLIEGARECAVCAGADGYLAKPCMPDHLYREVLRLLRRHGA
jgi:DNA-binding response OmpR family regulator